MSPKPLWPHHSADGNKDLTPIKLDYHSEILKDYFLYDRLGESLHYRLVHTLEYNSQQAPQNIQDAFQTALDQVFRGKVRPPEAMIVLAQGALFEKFNKSFLETLYNNDIKEGQIHWALKFIPEQHLNLQYQEHMENSHALDWSPEKNWSEKLQAGDVSMEQRLQELTIPGNGHPFQYMAGAVHYEIDLNKIEKRGRSLGQITFRKYYKVDETRPFRQYFESSGFRLEHIRLKSKMNSTLITVDLVETFDIDHLAPDLAYINLNFSGVIEKAINQNKTEDEKNRLVLVGELSTSDYDTVLFEMNLNELSFRMDKGLISSLNEDQSKYSIKLLPAEFDLEQSILFKKQIRNKVLREHQRDLMKSLKADLFSPRLMGGVKF